MVQIGQELYGRCHPFLEQRPGENSGRWKREAEKKDQHCNISEESHEKRLDGAMMLKKLFLSRPGDKWPEKAMWKPCVKPEMRYFLTSEEKTSKRESKTGTLMHVTADEGEGKDNSGIEDKSHLVRVGIGIALWGGVWSVASDATMDSLTPWVSALLIVVIVAMLAGLCCWAGKLGVKKGRRLKTRGGSQVRECTSPGWRRSRTGALVASWCEMVPTSAWKTLSAIRGPP